MRIPVGFVRSVGLFAAALSLVWSSGVVVPVEGEAQRGRTVEATGFAVWVDTPEHLLIGIVENVPETGEGVGFTIRCVRTTGELEGAMAFGFVPAGGRVQAAVRAPSGRVERFGSVVVGGRSPGLHVPEISGRRDVLRLMNAAMAEGALISNGHNSVRNRISGAQNARAKGLLNTCLLRKV